MNDKQELRRRMRRLRAAVSAAERAQAGELLADVVTRSSLVHLGDVLAAFAAFGSEIQTGPLIEGLRAMGKRVLLPRVHPSEPSMVDRTLKALLFVIFGAEYVIRILPMGTHHFGGLIRPSELRAWGRQNGMEYAGSVSVVYNLITRKFSLAEHRDPTYLMHFIKK